MSAYRGATQRLASWIGLKSIKEADSALLYQHHHHLHYLLLTSTQANTARYLSDRTSLNLSRAHPSLSSACAAQVSVGLAPRASVTKHSISLSQRTIAPSDFTWPINAAQSSTQYSSAVCTHPTQSSSFTRQVAYSRSGIDCALIHRADTPRSDLPFLTERRADHSAAHHTTSVQQSKTQL